MKSIIVAVFILLTINLNAQSIREELEETRPTKVENIWLKMGLISSMKASKFYDKDFENLKLFSEIKKTSFTFEKKKFEYSYQTYIKDPSFPIIIIQAGFMGNLKGRFTQTTMSILSEVKNHNIVVLETLSSFSAVHQNKLVSLGGLHESFQILDILKTLTTNNEITSNEVVLFGGSTSSFGTYHAQELLRNNSFRVNKTMLVAAYNDISTILNLFCKIDYKKSNSEECRGSVSKFKTAFKVLAKTFLKKVSTKYFSDTSFEEKYFKYKQADNFVGLYDLNRVAFEENKVMLKQMYFAIYNKDIEFENVFDYYQKISLDKHPQAIQSPLLWLHAKDDPMAISKDQFEVFEQVHKDNSLFVSYLLKHGGHGAYQRLYGRDWIHSMLDSFMNY